MGYRAALGGAVLRLNSNHTLAIVKEGIRGTRR
jgi:hypothetical protein